MPLYTLYLDTNNAVSYPAQQFDPFYRYSICNWDVNWDDLFEKLNYTKQTCRVRYKMVSKASTPSDGYTPDYVTGRLLCNLGSNQQATYNNNANYYPMEGCFLGLVLPSPTIREINDVATPYGTINYNFFLTGNTLDSEGVEVLTPVGKSIFSLTLKTDINTYNQKLIYFFYGYTIMLQFEFDD